MQNRDTAEKRTARMYSVGGFFLGLVIMVFLNRVQVILLLEHFNELWNIAQNRPVILMLLARIVLASAFFSATAFVCMQLINAFWRGEKGQGVSEGTFPPQEQGTSSLPSTAALSPNRQLPITPIPLSTLPEQSVAPPLPAGVDTNSRGTVLVPEETLDQTPTATGTPHLTLLRKPATTADIYIEIHLLKRVRMDLIVQDKRYPIQIEDLPARARHLIAYIAWQQGKPVRLDDMRTHVFGHEEADREQVQSAFNTAKRDIRRRIDQAIERVNAEAGEQVLTEDLDLFALGKSRKYSLPAYCLVVDLSLIEELHMIIEQAENGNLLVNDVPQTVKYACDALIKAYPGDFLEDLLIENPDAIDPWVQSWAREPFTHYRDYYLQALLYAGEYERKAGDKATDGSSQRDHYANAARLYAQGAMAACNKRVCDGRFDTKVFFAKVGGRRAGQHVMLSEQLIRRAIAHYGKIGSTTLASRAYGAYEQQMLQVSGRNWAPHPETTSILEDALKQTGAYKFPETIATVYDQSESGVPVESV